MENDTTDKKKELRSYLRKKIREFLSVHDRKAESLAICAKVLALEEYKKAGTVLAYIPLKNEADCLPVIENACLQGKTVAVPKVAGKDGHMDFFILKNDVPFSEQLESGAFGILEPKKDLELFDINFPVPADISASGSEDIFMILPGLGFTRDGKRLGKGGGFYDRYLERLMQAGLKAFKCGFCFDCQIVEDLPEDIYDKGADLVLCSQGSEREV